jgi:hypothetical protein
MHMTSGEFDEQVVLKRDGQPRRLRTVEDDGCDVLPACDFLVITTHDQRTGSMDKYRAGAGNIYIASHAQASI